MKWKELSLRILTVFRSRMMKRLPSWNLPMMIFLRFLDAAFAIRRRYFGWGVSIHVIRNAKSGLCSENCSFCSQSAVSDSDIPRYPMQSVEQIVEGAREAHELTAVRYCIVTSGRTPSEQDLDTICEAARLIKGEVPVQICTSLACCRRSRRND